MDCSCSQSTKKSNYWGAGRSISPEDPLRNQLIAIMIYEQVTCHISTILIICSSMTRSDLDCYIKWLQHKIGQRMERARHRISFTGSIIHYIGNLYNLDAMFYWKATKLRHKIFLYQCLSSHLLKTYKTWARDLLLFKQPSNHIRSCLILLIFKLLFLWDWVSTTKIEILCVHICVQGHAFDPLKKKYNRKTFYFILRVFKKNSKFDRYLKKIPYLKHAKLGSTFNWKSTKLSTRSSLHNAFPAIYWIPTKLGYMIFLLFKQTLRPCKILPYFSNFIDLYILCFSGYRIESVPPNLKSCVYIRVLDPSKKCNRKISFSYHGIITVYPALLAFS